MFNNLTIADSRESLSKTVRSKSSTVSQFRNTTSCLINKSTGPKVLSQCYKSQSVFFVRKPFNNGIFDFNSTMNRENSTKKKQYIIQSQKEFVRKRGISAHNVRKLKAPRSIQFQRKVVPIPLIQNCSQIFANFQQKQNTNKFQPKCKQHLKSRRFRFAIQRFDLKNRQMAKIQGLTGIRII